MDSLCTSQIWNVRVFAIMSFQDFQDMSAKNVQDLIRPAAAVDAVAVYCCRCCCCQLAVDAVDVCCCRCCCCCQLGGKCPRKRACRSLFDGQWCDVAEITCVTGNITGNPEPVLRVRFFGGTKVCTLTRTPGKPVAKPAGFLNP